ncbi:hypothetical protein [Algoriphagus sp. A40]|uniref:hypothetical protein n=1 Tax=Algoriphagus sp. A40 TaxID=1945863 RepID=UPI000984377C|nr:hypothetical protein [Algoriphagus sp. A40]OOG73766.1 hypothetical protein B0E43_13050 [Algoriphagus sp. A40]
MKRIYSLLILIGMLSFAFACNTEGDEDPLDVFREIAYNALSSDVKATVIGDWKDAEVSAWVDGYYLVTFQTNDLVLGPVQVVVDPVTGRWVEILPRF